MKSKLIVALIYPSHKPPINFNYKKSVFRFIQKNPLLKLNTTPIFISHKNTL